MKPSGIIKEPSILQAALIFAAIAVLLLVIFGSGLGIAETGFIKAVGEIQATLIPGTGTEYWSVARAGFQASESWKGSIYVFLGVLAGMAASILVFREFEPSHKGFRNCSGGFIGGITLGFGAAMLFGGAVKYFFDTLPMLSLAGVIGVIFIIIGIYVGNMLKDVIG